MCRQIDFMTNKVLDRFLIFSLVCDKYGEIELKSQQYTIERNRWENLLANDFKELSSSGKEVYRYYDTHKVICVATYHFTYATYTISMNFAMILVSIS